ncbi:MAG: tRNA guanosine(15) transglycosylase TgtA [Nitrososphaerales archaeon]
MKYTDLAGRIGKLKTNHGYVETPAFAPVVHPVRQSVSLDSIKAMGFDLVITNAYITKKQYGEQVTSIHDIIKFDGIVMTDSGGYQVLEYGDIDVSPKEMAIFEEKIGSDIAIPLDKPTGLKLERGVAESYVSQTLKAAEETINAIDNKKTIWAGPIQGGAYLDLVVSSAKRLDMLGYNMLALGSPTEVMESYEFNLLARMIISAKSSFLKSKPLHLFGAGHPLTIPLAVALGCDTFDSASYMLYARDDRYMLSNSTAKLENLKYLPCTCQICTRYTVQELVELENEKRFTELAKHNLLTIKAEIDLTKQSIVEGRLWEYVVQKAMSHPKLAEAIALFKEVPDYLEEGTPVYKRKAVFLFNPLDQYRPEVIRFRKMVIQNVKVSKDVLLLLPEPDNHPFYICNRYHDLKKTLNTSNIQLGYYSPFLGVVPEEISDVFPAAHHVAARIKFDANEFETFAEGLSSYIKKNGFKKVLVVADEFVENFLQPIEKSTKLIVLEKDATIEEITSAINSLER